MMNTRTHLTVPTAATLVALLIAGVAATGTAQTPAASPDKMAHGHEGMPGMKSMAGKGAMMEGPHQALAMAYRDNLVTFARSLQHQVAQTSTVNLDLARPATAEMRRSFDQMQQHHSAHMAMVGGQTTAPMANMMPQMESHVAALGEHLSALESEVNSSAPDPKNVSEHTAGILKACAGMSAMHSKAKPHQMK